MIPRPPRPTRTDTLVPYSALCRAVLGPAAGETRIVGVAVRDTLLGIGLDIADVDLATRHPPQAVLDRLRKAGIKAVPTGLAHGTITAVIDSGPVEVTTLRRDVSTDEIGRAHV